MIKYINKIPGRIKFLLIVLVLYGAIYFFNNSLVSNAFISATQTFVKVLPLILFVFFVMFLINIFLTPDIIKKHIGKDSGIKGAFYTFFGSLFIMGPPYILFPLLQDLKTKGMKNSLVALFLNNRNIQPIFLPVMAHYFGVYLTVILSFYIIIFTFITSFILGKLMDE